jgi:hypothetical protein
MPYMVRSNGAFGVVRIRPSWAVLATSLPSPVKMLARVKPRALEALTCGVIHLSLSVRLDRCLRSAKMFSIRSGDKR